MKYTIEHISDNMTSVDRLAVDQLLTSELTSEVFLVCYQFVCVYVCLCVCMSMCLYVYVSVCLKPQLLLQFSTDLDETWHKAR
jgi:hypothetical protein